MDRERIHNPEYADMDARESLKKSNAKLLYLQSEDDTKVKFQLGCKLLSEALEGRADTEFYIPDKRHHDPQRTERAAAADRAMLEDLNKIRKKLNTKEKEEEFKEKYDWSIIREQDPVSWKKITDFLES